MKLSLLVPLVAIVALATSPARSSVLDKRQAAQSPVQRPIAPADSLKRYIQEADKGVKLLNDSLNLSLQAGAATSEVMRLNEVGTFLLTSSFGDAANALRGGLIPKEQAQMVGPRLKKLTAHVVPIAKRVGDLKPFYDQMGETKAKEVALSLQYLAGSFDRFYQALKSVLDANASQKVAGYILEAICAIDAASTKLDSCTPLTDVDFCAPKNKDWDALPHDCPGMSKCKGDDIRKALYATYTSRCIDASCRGDDWCNKADGQDLCKWTPSQWMN